MSLDSKVIWSEGMFLNPQHFQQQERYLERYINNKCLAYGPYAWGFYKFEIDEQLLKLGKISIVYGSGIFPDGTPFDFPAVDNPPPVLDVPDNTHNAIVFLGVPVKRPGAVEVLPEDNTQGLARYYDCEQQARDISDDDSETLPVATGHLRYRLLLAGEDLSGYTVIGVTRIKESRDDKLILLDGDYIPSCLDCNVSPRLSSFLSELLGLLRHRGEAIAGRLGDTRRGGTAEIADYMLLQLINRLDPTVKHLSKINGLHPQPLYAELTKMLGELSTFFTDNKRPPQFPDYLHDKLQETFEPVMKTLREGLTKVYEQTAVTLDLQESRFGILVAKITDHSLVGSSVFVLAVKADMTDENLRRLLPAQMKIGSVETIRNLINAALPGIAIRPLPVAPRQLPFRAGYTYFELDRQSDYWKDLQQSAAFAVFPGGNFPGLKMEFWAIRQS